MYFWSYVTFLPDQGHVAIRSLSSDPLLVLKKDLPLNANSRCSLIASRETHKCTLWQNCGYLMLGHVVHTCTIRL